MINSNQYFSTVPNIQCPRSYFDRSFSHKFTMNVDYLYPFFIDEALPGDSFRVSFQCFGRLENPLIRPIMDEMYFETLWFKIPNRLCWNHWVNFCGEQDNPGDTTDYRIPTVNVANNGSQSPWTVQGIFDIFGIPEVKKGASDSFNASNYVNALPLRSYNRVFNEWFRDENLQPSLPLELGDSDNVSNYSLVKSNKMHDYFTSCLPFSQKGEPVSIPISFDAHLASNGPFKLSFPVTSQAGGIEDTYLPNGFVINNQNYSVNVNNSVNSNSLLVTPSGGRIDYPSDVNQLSGLARYAGGIGIDFGNQSGINVNDFRFAMALQVKRERDARGGTRYIEWVKSQFNVDSPDARLQRSEFLGSTKAMIDVNTVVQTSSSDGTSPQGNLSAYGVLSNFQSVVNTSFTEHSYLLGLCRIRSNPVYQQGISRLWKRSDLLDFYIPALIGFGEQPVYNYELYLQSDDKLDEAGNRVNYNTFGFQPAWSDYRFAQNRVSGYLRTGVTNSLSMYHLSEYFTQLPLLNGSFIQSNVPLNDKLALPTDIHGNDFPQFVMDVRFYVECARPMPVVDIPASLHNHF